MRIQLSRETIGRAFEMGSRRFRLLGRSLVGCGFCGTRAGLTVAEARRALDFFGSRNLLDIRITTRTALAGSR